MDILTFVLSFTGGGVVSALITQLCLWKQNEKKEKMRFIELQITKLYGPLFYHVSQNETLLGLSKRILEAGNEVFNDNARGSDNEMDRTIAISNKYVGSVNQNNEKMVKILDENYAYIDPDDIEIIGLFHEHYTRLNIEKGDSKLPLQIYRIVGDISFLRPEVIDRIKQKFLSKRSILFGQNKHWWRRCYFCANI